MLSEKFVHDDDLRKYFKKVSKQKQANIIKTAKQKIFNVKRMEKSILTRKEMLYCDKDCSNIIITACVSTPEIIKIAICYMSTHRYCAVLNRR